MLSFLRKFTDTKEKVLIKYLTNEIEKFLHSDIGKSYLFYNTCVMGKNKTCKVDIDLTENSSRDVKIIKTVNTIKCKEDIDCINISIGIEREYFDTYDLGSLSALLMIAWINQTIIKHMSNTDMDFNKAFNKLVKKYPEIIIYYKAGLLQSKIPNSITLTYFPSHVSLGDIIHKIV